MKVQQRPSYFFIGDIHGQKQKLEHLLHSSHLISQTHTQDLKIIFVGDLIDNNQQLDVDHLSVLEKVKELVDNQQAYVVMGNHEFNAVGWTLQRPDGTFCRSHKKTGNLNQHASFLQQVGENSQTHKKWINWFKSLPLFRELDQVRVIHACWHEASIQAIKPYLNADNSLKEEYWLDAFNPQHELFQLCENLLKGPELSLPKNAFFYDKNGIKRTHIRLAWWQTDIVNKTYRDLAVVPSGAKDSIPNIKIKDISEHFIYHDTTPVIIGHYTLPDTRTQHPAILSSHVVCVDFSAAKEGTNLVGYRMPNHADNKISNDYFEYGSKETRT